MSKMNEKVRNLLPWSIVFIISAAVFSGHFGVGDTIFPAILGRGTGMSWFIAALGYGVINSLGGLYCLSCSFDTRQIIIWFNFHGIREKIWDSLYHHSYVNNGSYIYPAQSELCYA
jgi:hypothetical protein